MQKARKPIDVKIAEYQAKKNEYKLKVDNYKTKIAELDVKITNLKNLQKQKELEKLLDVIKASGKTPEEVMSSLK